MNNGMRAALLLLIAISAVLLTTCSDTNIVALLTSEVKRANNRFLIVQDITPKEVIDVNPGVRWTITFDRPIDRATVDGTKVTIEPSAGITPKLTFSPDSKVLYVEAEPYLANITEYTVTITTGVKGADGSDLEQQRSWSFTTGIYPAGGVSINSGLALTGSTNVPLTLTCNDAAEWYSVATSEAGLVSWTSITTRPTTTIASFPINSGDGEQTVYVQFRQGLGSTAKYSVVKSDTIILDQTPPTVDAGPQRWVNASSTAVPAPSASDLNGIQGYLWTGVTCTPSAADLVPTFSNPGADGNYTVMLSVTDNAGNVGSDTMILTRDSIAPSLAPTFLSVPATPAIVPNPTWSWQGNSVNAGGGESPKIFRYRLNYWEPVESTWKPYYAYADKVTSTSYAPRFTPPKAYGLPDDRYRNTAYEPILYRMYVWETDNAGNLSSYVQAPDIAVTSVLPYNGATGVGTTPTLSWRALLNPKTGEPSRSYTVYIGLYSGPGKWEYMTRKEIPLPESGNPSWLVYKSMPLEAGVTYGWYVLASDFSLRSPLNGIIDKEDFWIFTP